MSLTCSVRFVSVRTLDEVPVGHTVVVAPGGIDHPRESLTARRLIHQGIVTGAELTVVRRTAGGGRVVGVGRSRIAVDPAVARGIAVQSPDGGPHDD